MATSFTAVGKRLYPVFLLYLVSGFVALTLLSWYAPTETAEDFAKMAGVVVSLVLGVMASHIAIQNTRLQLESTAALEKIRGENAQKLAEFQAALNSRADEFRNALQKELEAYKAHLAESSEEAKEWLRREVTAYDALFTAAFRFFRILEGMAEPDWDEKRAEEAIEIMREAEKYVVHVPAEYNSAWWRYYQHGYDMIEQTRGEPRLLPAEAWIRRQRGLRKAFETLVDQHKSFSKIRALS